MATLILNECRRLLKSPVYYVYLILLVIFFFLQMGEVTVNKPIPDSDYYGHIKTSDNAEIINATLESLNREYSINSYGTYPLGFYKEVTLNEEDQEFIGSIIEEVSENDLDYNTFLMKMSEVSQIIGSGSMYSEEMINRYSMREMTYEEAVNEYKTIVKEDKVTRALARLFADYMGIILGIIPVFVVVASLLSDKKHGLHQLLSSRAISSFRFVTARYLSLIVMMVLPLVCISLIPLSQGMYSAEAAGVQGDGLAFIRIIFGWLLPTIMAVTSLSYMITIIFNNGFAIFVQVGIWIISIFSGSTASIVGVFGFQLIPRFNSLGSSQIYREKFSELVLNRMGYSSISILILLITVWLYDQRRQGRLTING